MRTVTETITINDSNLSLEVKTSDGLVFAYPVSTSGLELPVKEFEACLGDARKRAYERRVWLNKRKSLSKDEIEQLLGVERTSADMES